MLFETFAVTAGYPRASSVGNVSSVPEPTTALIMPAPTLAASTASACQGLTGRPYPAVRVAHGEGPGTSRVPGPSGACRSVLGHPWTGDDPGAPRLTLGVRDRVRGLGARPLEGRFRVLQGSLFEVDRVRSVVRLRVGHVPVLAQAEAAAQDVADARRPATTQRLPDAAQSLGHLGRDDPDLVRRPLRDLREHLQVLVGEELAVRVGLVNRREHLVDRPRLTLRPQDRRLRLALGPEDGRLPVALGGEDLGLLDAFGVEDRGPPVPLGPHLLLHRVLHAVRRVDGLELDAGDPDAPPAGRLVEDAAELAVDLVPAGQRLLQVEGADDVAQGGH